MKLNEFEERIGYEFKDKALLDMALTHCSFNREKNTKHKDNERLEFLGDSILGFVTADFLYNHVVKLPEGQMTRQRAELVCEESLHKVALELNIGKYMKQYCGQIRQQGKCKEGKTRLPKS